MNLRVHKYVIYSQGIVMNIDFQQGIITYPSSGSIQRFLIPGTTSSYVTLSTDDGRTDITFAHQTENYLFTEASNTIDAWGPLPPVTDVWLYWDLDSLTAVRTFGFTSLTPLISGTQPIAPTNDQHWFDTSSKQMKVYVSANSTWRNVIRVFAAKYNNGVFTPLGFGYPSKPFAGSQVGISVSGIVTGRIIVDETGAPIRRSNGLFFTTEDEFFINGSPVNTIRLEANTLNATALESIAAYQVVSYTEFGKINLATYNILQTTAIAMAMENLNQNETGTTCMQGYITNPIWNWTTVGIPLWVDGSQPGMLTDTDPHVLDPITYPVGKPPVARVITPTSVFFDQGLGGKGDKGDSTITTLPLASDTVQGIVKLSLLPDDSNDPIAVGTNDPRLIPYVHPATHPATMITNTPVGILTGATVQDNINIIATSFVKKAGDTMSGFLTLNADPTALLHAATKQYVDTQITTAISNVTNNQINGTVFTISGSLSVPTTVAQFNANIYKMCKFIINCIDSVNNMHAVEILTITDGTNVYNNETGIVISSISLGTFTVALSGSTCLLIFNPSSAGTYTINTTAILQ